MKEQKELYCPKCKMYPTIIKEKYLEPIIEERRWSKEGIWELTEEGSNMDNVEFEQLCGKCGAKLIFTLE